MSVYLEEEPTNPYGADRGPNARPARMDWQRMVEEFHRVFGLTIGDTIAVRDPALRCRLLREECHETCAALIAGDPVEVADGLADLIYVALGTAVSCGIDLAPVFGEVHRSNLAKLGGKLDADGKLQKPANWAAPDVRGELLRQGWADPIEETNHHAQAGGE